ncbi:MAG: DMT family transporter [Sulfolobales archaeon]|nr:DMT family transporter [Sulfolobales archaeon]MCX8208100.1 DMT family transporter [Sulfolobales archaeon]MDW8010079.1 DMT family transporter [Sulfolobales archaeon]
MRKALGCVLILVAWLSISSASVMVVLSSSSSLVCAFWRLLIATIVITLYSLAFKEFSSVYPKNLRALLLSVISGTLLAAHFLTWMESLFYIPISLSTTIVVLYPLVAMLYETFLKMSRPRPLEIIGVITAFSGTVIAVRPYLARESLYGSILAFIGALTGAAYFTIGRILRRSAVGLVEYAVPCYATSTITVLAYSALTSQSLWPSRASSWIFLVLLAVVPMIGGHTVINYLMKYMKSYVATVIGFGEAPGATILASLILSQKVELNVAIGMVVVLLGALLTIDFREFE